MAPKGEDPDSVARESGVKTIMELKKAALPYLKFRLLDRSDEGNGIIAREKLVKELSGLASKISDPTRRSIFIQDAAGRLNVDLTTFRLAAPARTVADDPLKGTSPRFDPYEFDLLSVLLHSPGEIDAAFESIVPEDFDSKQLARIFAAMVSHYRETGSLDTHHLIENIRQQELVSILASLSSRQWPAEEIDSEAAKLIRGFGAKKLQRKRRRLREQLSKAEVAGDRTEADRILREMQESGLTDAN